MTVKVVSWNIAKRTKPWQELLGMDADVALLQEAGTVPGWVLDRPGVQIGPREHWDSHVWLAEDNLFDRWPMVVRLSDKVEVQWFRQVAPVSQTGVDEFALSGIGTAAAARVVPASGEPFVVVSMYGRWIRWHPTAKSPWRVGYPDGAVHRIVAFASGDAYRSQVVNVPPVFEEVGHPGFPS